MGIDRIFGLMGDANLFLVHSFVHDRGGEYLSSVHEAGAIQMAAGHSSVTGSLGVATITHGGAVANSVGSLTEFSRGRVPLLLIAGDTDPTDKWNLQNLPQEALVRATGAGFVQATSPEAMLDELARARHLALVERRPVVFNVAKGLQEQTVVYNVPIIRSVPPVTYGIPDDDIDQALGIMMSASRPVVLAGRGAIGEAAQSAVTELAVKLGAPVATTLLAKDLFIDDEFNLGFCGNLATPEGLQTIVDSDCVVAFGASLNSLTSDSGDILAGKKLIQVDNDPTALDRFFHPTITILGDCAQVAELFIGFLGEADAQPSGYRSERLREALVAAQGPAEPNPASGYVNIGQALDTLNQEFPRDRVLTLDAGRFMFETLKRLKVPHPRAYVHTAHTASIGLGMGTAIGAALGSGKPTMLVIGDGGLMLGGLAELHSAVRHGADLTVVVMNDSSYGAEHIQFGLRGLDPTLSTFDWPEFADVAASLGAAGMAVASDADLKTVGEFMRDSRGPRLIDIKLHPEEVPTAWRH